MSGLVRNTEEAFTEHFMQTGHTQFVRAPVIPDVRVVTSDLLTRYHVACLACDWVEICQV